MSYKLTEEYIKYSSTTILKLKGVKEIERERLRKIFEEIEIIEKNGDK